MLLKQSFTFFFPSGFPYHSTYSASKHALHVRIYLLLILYVYAPVDPDFADILIVVF